VVRHGLFQFTEVIFNLDFYVYRLVKTPVMKITLFGAAGCVTGSAYYVQSRYANIMVDLGIFQGEKALESKNHKLPPIDVRSLDAVIITHAHLDHTGRLPLLARSGYKGPVFATEATIEIMRIILGDAVHIQALELERKNKKRIRNGDDPLVPDYSEDDVANVLKLMVPIPYNQYVKIAQSLTARVREAGHLLGSVSIEIAVNEDNKRKVVLFSGDLGRQDMAIIKDPDPFHTADLVFMESTYGDHNHKSIGETLTEARDIIARAVERRGKILVPSFAIGRAQQLLYYMARAVHRGKLPEIPVYLDSPMGIEATKIYAAHPELFDEEAEELFRLGVVKGDFSRLNISLTADDSRALNDVPGPCMILAGAGMCNAGRILHHLRNNLQFPETTVMIIGYQGAGTLGRRLVEKQKRVRIFGKDVTVNADIVTLGGLSAHAGQSDLLKWFEAVAPSKPKLVLSHGEEKGRKPLSEIISAKYGITPLLPEYGDTVTI
jgi:metallo-beta-lactamase family protein